MILSTSCSMASLAALSLRKRKLVRAGLEKSHRDAGMARIRGQGGRKRLSERSGLATWLEEADALHKDLMAKGGLLKK